MILSAFCMPLIVPLYLGLAFGQFYPSSKDSASIACHDNRCFSSTVSTSQAQATFDIGSDLLNISGSIKFGAVTVTITTAITTCPTTQMSWNRSIAVSRQHSSVISMSNETFAGRNSSLTWGQYENNTFKPTNSHPPPTTVATSLIFDHSTAPEVSATAANTSILTSAGSRYHLSISDSLVLILAGAVQMGIV